MTRPAPLLHAILVLIAAAALALPLVVVRMTPAAHHTRVQASPRIAVPTEPPPVEPVELQDLSPDEARAWNDSIPFAKGPKPVARPFDFVGSAVDLARATDCLAAAGYYEAGDDSAGERAVVQVVLNRLRHPAFPKTICGVVFQGAERATGCQFTFTCDGAMTRRPSEGAWRRARQVATAALHGAVYRPVGYATHYHTDWVVPYWSASLDKIAEVHTHLFFRWAGWWGTPPAFNRGWAGGEPMIAVLAALSDAHRAAPVDDAKAALDAEHYAGRIPPSLADDPDTFLARFDPAQAAQFPVIARATCGQRTKCKVIFWTDAAKMGYVLPLAPDEMAAMSFSYIRDKAAGLDRTLWNCNEFKARAPCMKRQVMRLPVVGAAASVKITGAATPPNEPAELRGVRRKPSLPDPPPLANQN
ncbi:cell wall hydrolase [uncultured Sphingomonas sp.]|uniref:cell wall hydrolase n=1 Tax=uncultured Sphingomonas sp. TaxID=158754 RepID=UPI0026216B3D|nr:cell wall hydrolase [uncultured Sphingomonas sp.]